MKIEKFKVEEWMNKYEALADYDLSSTCISPLSIKDLEHIVGRINYSIFEKKLDYGEIKGSPRLKNAIKTLYHNIDEKEITITHGAIGANQLIFLSLVEKGDEVISIVPTYQQHYSIPKSLGAKVKLLFLKEENNWLPSIEELEKCISKKTKLICINNPNNPTGSVIPNIMLEEIVKIAEKNNCWILSDEAYRGLNLIGEHYSKSIFELYPNKGISVGSMSKTYSLPGLRLGWIAANKSLIKEINHQREYNTISVSILDDFFASIALENRAKIEKRNFEILTNGHNIFKNWIEKEPRLSCILPQGGTTAFVKYNLPINSYDFCRDLQQKTSVALLPGETFEMNGYFRLGFAQEKSYFTQALQRISEYLINL